MRLQIGICDDETQIQFMIEEFLGQILKEKDIEADIECYGSGEELCKSYEKGMFDLIFLDIEYQGMNGVEIGRFIREEKEDDEVEIAYISGETKYAMELFEYQPINFLVKPMKKSDVNHVVEKYILRHQQKDNVFQYKIGGDIYQVALSDIVYFSSSARKVTIHKRDGEAQFYGSLEQIYSRVKGKRFLYVHKSYIVNYNCIRKMEYEQVTLNDKSIIPISQSRRTAIRKQFFELKKGEM